MIKRLSAARAGGKLEPGGMNSPKQVGRRLPGEEREVPAHSMFPQSLNQGAARRLKISRWADWCNCGVGRGVDIFILICILSITTTIPCSASEALDSKIQQHRLLVFFCPLSQKIIALQNTWSSILFPINNELHTFPKLLIFVTNFTSF